ncbi:hypothetical protein CLDAP_39320 [Caldilinea aerophila DSM 14535 = NBRC 104270]|uniref:Uncharacterized protein n=1 Tax=Caldilinea aerophila (strain DSM 14535 / JCM 11387 / NBRC 104270 / STL-6-O1) TaxID=926550 RepID=I0I9N4_CALAS|nr:hypothetical protein CLDAP_39320 [Caldilinea aerophila DSM 14535 = NBRC 104270]
MISIQVDSQKSVETDFSISSPQGYKSAHFSRLEHSFNSLYMIFRAHSKTISDKALFDSNPKRRQGDSIGRWYDESKID